ncbi:MAG: type II toxin-antitoxin system PemK/MazF family toxin [Caldilineaceae bacterium]
MVRGSVWWATLPDPIDSTPGYRRPVVIIQADSFNRSQLKTVIIAAITSNTALAHAPGNIFLPARSVGLPKDSVINVSQLFTIDKARLEQKVAELSPRQMQRLEESLRLVMAL